MSDAQRIESHRDFAREMLDDELQPTLVWMPDNAAVLGARAERFIVAGHSAGGGLAAAVTLAASDAGDADIAFQMSVTSIRFGTKPWPSWRHRKPQEFQ